MALLIRHDLPADFIGDLVHHRAVVLRARDPVGGVQAGQHELDARRPHRRILEALTSKALSQTGGTRFSRSAYFDDGSMSPDFDLHALRKDLGDLVQPVLVDVFLEHGADRFGQDRVQHLPLGHLMAAHQVEFQLAQRRRVEMPQVADPRHGGPLAQHDAALPGAGDHRAIVGDAEPGAHARLLVDVLRSCGPEC